MHSSTDLNRVQPADAVNGRRTDQVVAPAVQSPNNSSGRMPPVGVSIASWTQSAVDVRHSQSRPTSARSLQSQRSHRSASQGHNQRLSQHILPNANGTERHSVQNQSRSDLQSVRSSSGSRSMDTNSPLCVTDVAGIGRALRVSSFFRSICHLMTSLF
jgi:hypothetical protein